MTRFVSTAAGAGAQVLPPIAYALWAMIGTSLTLGQELNGRGEILVQLSLGLTFLTLGLAAASLRHPLWRLLARPTLKPSRERLFALATLLPMLGVAGLVRGGNDFWATRTLGAALALGCLLTLLVSATTLARRHPAQPGIGARALLAWLFCGGLWFRACLVLQASTGSAPVAMPLLLLLMLLGLTVALSTTVTTRPRLLASLLAFVVPCLLLAVISMHRLQLFAAAVAALCATAGLGLDAAWAKAPAKMEHAARHQR